MKFQQIICLLLVLFLSSFSFGQNDVYLIGNLKGPKLKKRLKHFERTIEEDCKDSSFTLVLLGDLQQKNTENEDTLIAFIKRVQLKGASIIAVTGDRDWDKSQQYGLDSVTAMQSRFHTKIGHNIFIPKKNCPGPKVKDIGTDLRIIGINSQWWLHPYRKTIAVDSECKNILKVQILDELEEAIKTANGRKVIMVTHHPIVSGGVYGGNSHLIGHLFPYKHDKPNNKVFLPFYGTFYHKYRQNIGTSQDFSSAAYKTYINDIENVLYDFKDVVVCSSHEYDLEVLKLNNNYQIISGSFLKSSQVSKTDNTIYKNNALGFVKLETTDNKELVSKVYLYDKVENIYKTYQTIPLHNAEHEHFTTQLKHSKKEIIEKTDSLYVAGNYGASKFKRLFLGDLYRNAWTTPVKIPTLSLDSIYGGLTPSERGGGLQTISLKFTDSDGRKYAFRSINKTPIKSIPKEFRLSLVNDITQDMTATQHPYGALFVASLLNATELYHGTPKLYIMPDSPILGPYQKQFAGMFGMLEPKPTQLDDLSKSYQNSNKVKSTTSLYKKIYNSPKTFIDTTLYAKARVFDIFIGDWDRHQDNWKWVGVKLDSNHTEYKPYPKDRDHAFSRMDGLFYSLANKEWGIAFRENFSSEFSGLKSLTLKANHLDRMFLSGLTREDWKKAAITINTQITDSVIDLAKKAFPKEIQEQSGEVIAKKLKQRKIGLLNAVDDYYELLSKEVDIIGTNKAEFFKIVRLPSGEVNVSMHPKENLETTLYNRTFLPDETKEIRIYGLAAVDSFHISGDGNKKILIRIIGGTETDVIINEIESKGGYKKIKIYDYPNGIELNSYKGVQPIFSENSDINEYDQTRHKYSTYLPIPLLIFNPDDGFGAGFMLNAKTFGYDNFKFKTAYSIKAFATSKGSKAFAFSAKRNIDRTNLYATSKIEYGTFFPFYSFYGIGNNSTLNDSVNNLGLYKARYAGAILFFGSEYQFYEHSSFEFNAKSELLKKGHADESYFDYTPSPSLEPTIAHGIELKLDLDFRDSKTFTTKGIRLTLANESMVNGSTTFGKSGAELSYYGTSKIGIPITLGIKVGLERTYGKIIPFYHLANLGQGNNLRGFAQNRFSGNGSNYLNTDMRFHLGKIKSGFLPMYFGIILFGDVGQIVERDALTDVKWHKGYGGGVYLTPINKDFISLKINVQRSVENEALLKIGLGVLLN